MLKYLANVIKILNWPNNNSGTTLETFCIINKEPKLPMEFPFEFTMLQNKKLCMTKNTPLSNSIYRWLYLTVETRIVEGMQ